MFEILEDRILSRQVSTHTYRLAGRQIRDRRTHKNVPIYAAEAVFHLRV